MKIFVTGASGFIGQNLMVQLAKEQVEVAYLSRQSDPQPWGSRFQLIQGSLDDLASIEEKIKSFNPDVCLHLAWTGIPDYSNIISQANLNQSVQLIDLLLDKTQCQKIIVTGSCYEYGKSVGRLDEQKQEENISAVAWAKNSIKSYLALRADQKGVQWAWIRVFYAFGPGQRAQSLIPSLVAACRQNLPSPIKNPRNANDFIYVDDVVGGLILACKKSIESGVYNLGSGRLLKVSEIWQIVQSLIDPTKQHDIGLTQATASSESLVDAVGGFANIEKSKMILGWSPMWDTRNAIQHYVNYLIARGSK